jgi:hypothetical protein
VDLAIAVVVILLMIVGLPGIAGAGAAGRWLAVNYRAAFAAAVACGLPFVALGRQGQGEQRMSAIRTAPRDTSTAPP